MLTPLQIEISQINRFILFATKGTKTNLYKTKLERTQGKKLLFIISPQERK